MNIEEVQRRLWEQSQAHRQNRESGTPLFPTNPYGGRSRNLMDLMHNPTWIAAACDRVLKRSRGKAPGVDGMTAHEFARNRESHLEQLRLELKRSTYRPLPLRRVEIPKANGKMRQLGIPCLRDKIVQEAIRMALEPIFEVEFHDNSYGFRPKRSTHHAVGRCAHMAHNGFTWIIEGDVKACFDEISHKAILRCVREKVMDNAFLKLIDRLLKAGVQVDGIVRPTIKGVPQGGVVSPLLANVVLNKLDWFLHSKGFHDADNENRRRHGLPNIRFARYADDWCVFLTRCHRRYAERLRDEIRDFLRETCGLELSAEKTRITHVRDGYDFLGFNISMGVGKSGELVPKVRVGRKAITNIQRRLDEAFRYRPTQESISVRLARGSTVIRGWANYYKIAHNFSQVANGLDHKAFWIAVKAICRKADISAAKCLRRHRFGNTIGVHDACTLARFADTASSFYYVAPEPYQPGRNQCYLEDDEWETAFVHHEQRRPGCGDLKWKALVRDGFHCRGCAVVVTSKTSHADHIEPVSRFANLDMANSLDNIQTLCHWCHKLKHARQQ
ncbi:MAG: group II intron reverse transcriptase/maturase [Thermoguttaceae bacterium]